MIGLLGFTAVAELAGWRDTSATKSGARSPISSRLRAALTASPPPYRHLDATAPVPERL
jgi:hypothetical protein